MALVGLENGQILGESPHSLLQNAFLIYSGSFKEHLLTDISM